MNRMTLSLLRLEYSRLKYIMAFLIVIPLLLVIIAYFPSDIVYYSGLAYFRHTAAIVMILLMQPLLPLLAALLLGSSIISEDTENDTLLHILSLPVNRSRLWAVRHLTRGSLFCIAMLLWYVLSHASDKMMLDNYIKLFSGQDRLILLFLGGCIIFAVSSALSSMMESNFSSAFAGFLSGLAVIFIVRKSPLAYPYFDWLLLFSVIYFLIVSLDLFTCGQPLSFRSLWQRFSLWLLAFLCIMYIPGLFI